MPESAQVKLGRCAGLDILTFWFLHGVVSSMENFGVSAMPAWDVCWQEKKEDEVKVFANKAGSTLGLLAGCSNPGNRWSGWGLALLTAYHPLLPNTQSQYASRAVLLLRRQSVSVNTLDRTGWVKSGAWADQGWAIKGWSLVVAWCHGLEAPQTLLWSGNKVKTDTVAGSQDSWNHYTSQWTPSRST